MTSKAMGEGERAEARQQARMRNMIVASLVCAVLIIVAALTFRQSGGRIAPEGAIAIVMLYLTAVIGFGWWTCRRSDEVEIRHNVAGLATAGGLYWLAYPGWYFLWKGGLVPEPSHEALFVAVIVVTMLGYFRAKLRG